MRFDVIKEIKIDDLERLCIFPAKERFTIIFTLAKEIHWDNNQSFLYSPKPRDWSYLDWYKHIIITIKDDCFCDLSLTKDTLWINIPESLKKDILNVHSSL